MPYTNKFNLPETICNAIMYESKYEDGKYSVTNLIKPPQIYQLEKRYQAQIERDVSDGLWMLLGSSVHYILEKAKPENALKEERLEIEMGGIRVVGKPDLYTARETIEDYKITSAWSFLLGEKPEWTAQLNIYAYLYSEGYGFPVKKAFIHAILRDWSKSRLLQDEDYPPCPFITSEIELWDKDSQQAFVIDRIVKHECNKKISDDVLGYCTPQEKWSKPTTWAVKKKGNKRALRVFDTFSGATDFQKNADKDLVIEERPGEDIRCERFCYAKPFCHQYKREHYILGEKM